MKKTILAMVLMGSGAAVMAQDSLSVNTDNMNNSNTSANQMQKSTGDYPAYGSVVAPAAVQHSFNQQYPGTTDAQWQRSYNGYWRATYRQNGMPVNVYYADNGQSFTVALPVLQGAVPPEVVAKAIDLYGNSLYDITMVKVRTNDNAWSNNSGNMNANTNNNGMNGTTAMTGNSNTTGTANTNTQNRYIIRVIENGMLRAERMNEDGTPDQTYGTNNANAGMNSGINSTNNGTATMNNNTNVNTDMNATTNGTSGSLNHSGSYSAYYGTTDGSNGSYYGTDSSLNQQSGSNMNQSGNWNNTNNSSNQIDSSNSNSGNSNNSNVDQSATGNLNSTNTNGTKTGTKKTTKKKS
jgi:hypothetical protein